MPFLGGHIQMVHNT